MATAKVICLFLLCFVSAHQCGKVLSGFMGGSMDMPSWVKAFSQYTNTQQTIAHYSTSFVGGSYLSWQKTVMDQAWAMKSVPFISLDPSPLWPLSAPTNISAIVLRGDHDSFLDEYTTWLKNWLSGPDQIYGTSDDRRVFMRYAHEFNIYPWKGDPEKFILMWRYVWNKFRVKGLDYLHIQWVWCISGGSSTWDMDRPPIYIEDYYPGDAYVDWLSYDSYNWGTLNSYSSWIDVPTTHNYSINRVSAISPNKPISIAETSCGVAGGSVAMKNTWLTNLYPFIASTNKVQMIVMFNTNADGSNWVFFAPGAPGNDLYTYPGGPYMGAKNFTAYSAMKTIGPYVYNPSSSTNPRILTDAEFLGQLSVSKPCPNNCSNRGSCNLVGVCACMEGWSGSSCTVAVPIPQCKGVGSICSSKGDCIDGKCYCDADYVGEGCHIYAPNSTSWPIYVDGLQATWRDKESNTPINYAATNIRLGSSGTSMSIDLNNWGFVYWEKSANPFYKNNFGYLNFWVYSTSNTSFSKLWISVQGNPWNEVSQKLYVHNYIIGVSAPNKWLEVRMPASAFQITSTGALTGFLVRPVQFAGVIYIDNVTLVNANSPVIPTLPALADVIYDGTIRNGWYRMATGNASLTSTIARTVPHAISLQILNWQGVYFEKSVAVDKTKYSGVSFWMRGNVANLQLRIGYSTNSWSILNNVILQSPPINSWAFYNISFSQLGATSNDVRGIQIQSNAQAYLGVAYIDDIALVPK